jgi:NADPH-dependent 2,4-dienoyl-CoA reductase/sulfur reductase-like enzyme
VTTEGGRRFDCEILGVTAGVRPSVDWLRNVATPPEIGRGVAVGPDFATSLDHVWAAGDIAEIRRPGERPFVEQIWYSAKRQGRLAALAMLCDRVDYRPPTFFNSSKFFEIEFTTVGKVFERPTAPEAMVAGLPPGSRHFYSRVPGRDVSLRIVERDGAVIGFNMLGSRWNHAILSRWIEERRSLDYVIGQLREAQFDVEFGRLDLAGVRAQYERWKHAESPDGVTGRTTAEGGPR